MKNSEILEIVFEVILNRVGLEEDFFGYIAINNKKFDLNLSTPYPVNQLREHDLKTVRTFLNSVELTLLDPENKKVELELREFLFFYKIFLIPIKRTYQNVALFKHVRMKIPLFFPKKTIEFLNQPKFNCGIIC